MKRNKYPKEVVEQKQTVEFSWEWIGNRIPEFIILPSHKKVKVQTMRNDKIILDDGTIGNYKRTLDNNRTQERAIILEIENG